MNELPFIEIPLKDGTTVVRSCEGVYGMKSTGGPKGLTITISEAEGEHILAENYLKQAKLLKLIHEAYMENGNMLDETLFEIFENKESVIDWSGLYARQAGLD